MKNMPLESNLNQLKKKKNQHNPIRKKQLHHAKVIKQKSTKLVDMQPYTNLSINTDGRTLNSSYDNLVNYCIKKIN